MRAFLGWTLAIGTGASPLALLVDWSSVWRALCTWFPLGMIGLGINSVDSIQWALRVIDSGKLTGCGCTDNTYTFIGSVDTLDVMRCNVCGCYDVVDTSE